MLGTWDIALYTTQFLPLGNLQYSSHTRIYTGNQNRMSDTLLGSNLAQHIALIWLLPGSLPGQQWKKGIMFDRLNRKHFTIRNHQFRENKGFLSVLTSHKIHWILDHRYLFNISWDFSTALGTSVDVKEREQKEKEKEEEEWKEEKYFDLLLCSRRYICYGHLYTSYYFSFIFLALLRYN